MSTTPRTDALQDELLHADTYTCCQEFQKLAMKLERELSAMQTRAEKAEADCERFRLYTFKQDAKVAELLSMLA